MRKWLIGVGSGALFVAAAGGAGAATLPWEGTLNVQFGNVPPFVSTGMSAATINHSSGGGHLNTLAIAGGISGSATLPLTDPATPLLVSVRGTLTLGTGTLSGISGGAPLAGGVLPVGGLIRLCLVTPGCGIFLPIPATVNSTRGLGIGGLITVNGFATAGLRISVEFAPWTIGLAAVTGLPTGNGGTSTVTAQGFAHGPMSATSSTANALGSGVLQVVTPARITLTLAPPNDMQAVMTTLTLHFIPEPGMLLLLGSGVAGLVLLGQRRLRD